MNKAIINDNIKIRGVPNRLVYSFTSKALSFLIGKNVYNKLNNTEYIDVLTSPETCRELTIEQFKLKLFRGYFPEIFLNYEMTDIRTVLCVTGLKDPSFLQRGANNSLKILNILENELGWSLSSANIVKWKTQYFKTQLISFESCTKYYKYTEILSLYLLLLRIGCNEKFEMFFTNIQTTSDLIKALDDLNKSSSNNKDKDHIYYYKKWFEFLNNLEKIYENISTIDSYRRISFQRYGITSFCEEQK